MNMTRLVYRRRRVGRTVLLLLAFSGGVTEAAVRRTGEAMVADQIGAANVRLTVGTVHHGQSELVPLFEGASVGETARISTGSDSHLLMVFDPGGLLALDSNTDITINRLRRVADGLPGSLADVHGRVEIKLHAGQIKVSGPSRAGDSVRVVAMHGTVQADGSADFIVASDPQGGFSVASLRGSLSLADRQGKTLDAIHQGEALSMDAHGQHEHIDARIGMDRRFMMWNSASGRLRRSMSGVEGSTIRVAGLAAGVRPTFLGPARVTLDVSPTEPEPEPAPELAPEPVPEPDPVPEADAPDQSFRPPVGSETVGDETPVSESAPQEQVDSASEGDAEADQPVTAMSTPSEPGVRRSNEEILSWYNNVGVIKGVNYTPPNVNDAAEMWSAENFLPDQIQQDLRLAKDTGYTDIRVQLSIQEWFDDPEGFLNRVGEFAQMTSEADLRFVPVLLDPVNLLQSGYMLEDIALFVTTVLNNFKDSGNVLYWDLFEAEGASGMDEAIYDLLREVVKAARGVGVVQPITVASLSKPDGSDLMLDDADGSDLITFSSFDSADVIEAKIKKLKELGRPVICTDWLNRTNENTFDKLLPLFSANQVGWFNRGLVRPEGSVRDGSVWQDHLFDQNGNPYDTSEIELIRGFIFEKELE